MFILIRISLSKNNITVASINRLIHLDNETVSFIITSKELKPTRRSSISCWYKNGCITDIDDDINKNHAKDLGNSVVMHSHVLDAIQATFLNQSNTHTGCHQKLQQFMPHVSSIYLSYSPLIDKEYRPKR